MSTLPTDIPAELARQAEPLLRLTSNETFVRVRDACTRLVREHPASTVLGAFAVGFVLARVFRHLTED